MVIEQKTAAIAMPHAVAHRLISSSCIDGYAITIDHTMMFATSIVNAPNRCL